MKWRVSLAITEEAWLLLVSWPRRIDERTGRTMAKYSLSFGYRAPEADIAHDAADLLVSRWRRSNGAA